MHLKSETYKTAFFDIYSGRAKEFSVLIEKRLTFLKRTEKINVIFKPIETPYSIYIEDLFPDPNHTVNVWYVEMINRQFDKQIQNIQVLE